MPGNAAEFSRTLRGGLGRENNVFFRLGIRVMGSPEIVVAKPGIISSIEAGVTGRRSGGCFRIATRRTVKG